MKKSLLIGVLFFTASFQANAQFNPGTNSYDYGCGVGVPPSVCGASGSSGGNSSSNKSKRKCSDVMSSLKKAYFQVLKEEGLKGTYKYIGPVDGVDNAYAFKIVAGKDDETRFVLLGNTGEVYFSKPTSSDPNPRLQGPKQLDDWICRK